MESVWLDEGLILKISSTLVAYLGFESLTFRRKIYGDCSSIGRMQNCGFCGCGFEPHLSHQIFRAYSSVWSERDTHNVWVTGSSPVRPTKLNNAPVVELVDTFGLSPNAIVRIGSSPIRGTNRSVTQLVRVIVLHTISRGFEPLWVYNMRMWWNW